jgi:hypothetical protein
VGQRLELLQVGTLDAIPHFRIDAGGELEFAIRKVRA